VREAACRNRPGDIFVDADVVADRRTRRAKKLDSLRVRVQRPGTSDNALDQRLDPEP